MLEKMLVVTAVYVWLTVTKLSKVYINIHSLTYITVSLTKVAYNKMHLLIIFVV